MPPPEGVGIGTSYQALKVAYPNWTSVSDGPGSQEGRGLVSVPGNSTAEYRIVVSDGKVSDLAIQTKRGHCYE